MKHVEPESLAATLSYETLRLLGKKETAHPGGWGVYSTTP